MTDPRTDATTISPRFDTGVVAVPTPPPPANRAVVRPSTLAAPGTFLQYPPPTFKAQPPHPVDVRRPRHATTQPSWWRRERTHVLAGLAGGGLVLFVVALVYVSWGVLS